MKLFKKKEETSLIVQENPVVVAVPDIKEYLVKEYERVNSLLLKNEALEAKLETAKETQLKYDATLVTLDEYSERLKRAEEKIANEKTKAERAQAETKNIRDELNSYKIKFNNLALTKEDMREEIIEETKKAIISEINGHKGNLSKNIVCEIINRTKIYQTEKQH